MKNHTTCSVLRKLRIEPGDINDYKQLAHYHYRENRIGPHIAIFALKAQKMLGATRNQTVGVIVYAPPVMEVEMRNIALGGMLNGLTQRDKLSFVNNNIHNISRVVIEPRFRGLGLATRLVHETLDLVNVHIVEAIAVMGQVNPFFEKAGMTAYTGKLSLRWVQLTEALNAVGINKEMLIDPWALQKKLDAIPRQQGDFLERQMKFFLQIYSSRRNMQGGIKRTKYVLSKLTERPVYYVWFNKNLEGKTDDYGRYDPNSRD